MNEVKKLAEDIGRMERRVKAMKERISQLSAEVHGDNLSVLLLETAAENALRKEGIDSLKKLVAKTEFDLTRFPMIGRKYLRQIKGAMASRNMYLRE